MGASGMSGRSTEWVKRMRKASGIPVGLALASLWQCHLESEFFLAFNLNDLAIVNDNFHRAIANTLNGIEKSAENVGRARIDR